jgi:hypothetical protein
MTYVFAFVIVYFISAILWNIDKNKKSRKAKELNDFIRAFDEKQVLELEQKTAERKAYLAQLPYQYISDTKFQSEVQLCDPIVLVGIENFEEDLITVHGRNAYDLSIRNLTCTCSDWKLHRSNYAEKELRRVCKHLAQQLIKANFSNAPLIKAMLNRAAVSGGVAHRVWMRQLADGSTVLFGTSPGWTGYSIYVLTLDLGNVAIVSEEYYLMLKHDQWIWSKDKRPTGRTREIRNIVMSVPKFGLEQQSIGVWDRGIYL